MAGRGSRGIALPFLDHSTRRGWGVSVMLRPLFTPGKDAVPIVQEAGWAPGPVWTCAENLAPTGIRSPDRLAYSQSLYQLSYSGHRNAKRFENYEDWWIFVGVDGSSLWRNWHRFSCLSNLYKWSVPLCPSSPFLLKKKRAPVRDRVRISSYWYWVLHWKILCSVDCACPYNSI